MRRCLIVVAVIASVVWPGRVDARVDVDRPGGEFRTVDVRGADRLEDVLSAPDGSSITVGTSVSSGDADITVVRFRPDGQVDSSFGNGGAFVLANSGPDHATGGALQPDGRILVAGSVSTPTGGRWIVLRLSPSGGLDPGFGSGGRVIGDQATSVLNDVVVGSDGWIFAAGWIDRGGQRRADALVIKLNPSGGPAGFGTGGAAEIDLGSTANASSDECASSVAVLPDGRVVLAGSRAISSGCVHGTDVLVARLTRSGTLDPSFGGNGAVTRDFGSDSDRANGLVAEADGSVIVAGVMQPRGDVLQLIARFSPDGRLDERFGTGSHPYPRLEGTANAIARDEAGRYVVVATVGTAAGRGLGVVRLRPGGQLDTSFSAGVYRPQVPAFAAFGEAVAIAGDRIILAGYTGDDPSDLVLGRLLDTQSSGYWMVAADGAVYSFGDARYLGGANPSLGFVDIEAAPGGNGYWAINSRGEARAYGQAATLGLPSPPHLQPGETVASLSVTPTGGGFLTVTSKGRVSLLGDAGNYGDMAGVPLNGAVLDSTVTPSGRGYYMVASDGGIFTFGDAEFHGSMGGQHLNAPVQSLVPTPSGHGYWLVATDGGVFSFGDAPFRGSMGDVRLNRPITGMVTYGNGYLMVAEDGGIFNFSDRDFAGSLGDNPPPSAIVAVAATPT